MNETMFGFSIENIKEAIKREVEESSTTPYQFWLAYYASAKQLNKDAEWLLKIIKIEIENMGDTY